MAKDIEDNAMGGCQDKITISDCRIMGVTLQTKKTRSILVALSVVLSLKVWPAWSTVVVLPPPLSELSGSYVGSVAGSTLQRLVLNPDGTGYFADVWFDAKGQHAAYYRVTVKSYQHWKIKMDLVPLQASEQTMSARGEASYFTMNLELGATGRYRKRSVTLFREETFRTMLDFAHENWPPPDKSGSPP